MFSKVTYHALFLGVLQDLNSISFPLLAFYFLPFPIKGGFLNCACPHYYKKSVSICRFTVFVAFCLLVRGAHCPLCPVAHGIVFISLG